MYLQNLNLYSFRNYYQEEISFKASKIILTGDNAQGKSNLLEAIELLSILKSYRINKDQHLVQENQSTARITANLKRKLTNNKLSLILRKNGRRTLNVNGENVKRNADFLGHLNTVFFSSLDLNLVRGGPEYRRNWVDNLVIQLQPVYDHILKEYSKVLKQRNALLKEFKKQDNHEYIDDLVIDKSNRNLQLKVWDQKLADLGTKIIRRRTRILNRIIPIAKQWHSKISSETECLDINYSPNVICVKDDHIEVQKAIENKIQERRVAEFSLGTTVVGPHRDEINFTINDTPVRIFGSQGQQRTFVLSLKLAEIQLIEEVIGEPPLLLLDDVFAELDIQRQNHLLNALGNHCQTFITTTNLNFFNSKLLQNSQVLKIEKGKIKAI